MKKAAGKNAELTTPSSPEAVPLKYPYLERLLRPGKAPRSTAATRRALLVALVKREAELPELAAVTGVGVGAVLGWVYGTELPTADQAQVLEDRFGIDAHGWRPQR